MFVFHFVMKPSCNIFWFKRDLRLEDNEALTHALGSNEKLLLVYLLEPSLESDPHYSTRHWDFVRESLLELQDQLASRNTAVLSVRSEVIPFFEALSRKYRVRTVFSHVETGTDLTYRRDLQFAAYCREEGIAWKEFQNNGVLRGSTNREGWVENWNTYMRQPVESPPWERANTFNIPEVRNLGAGWEPTGLPAQTHGFQKGGRREALKYLNSFLTDRVANYSSGISKPEASRSGCSRLSPYLAWGNLSIREVYQQLQACKARGKWQGQYRAFGSRLRWHCHFIQKFEAEPRMEFEAVNRAFLDLEQPVNRKYITAWENGQTGYPLIDAAMRCVRQTGYINFRLRAMVVSFLTHHLFQHFREGSHWLARHFLDFEPGIHYGQLQMQAGFTGTNTVRVYNPTKNAMEHDPEALFIKKYVPELQQLPPALAIEPWRIQPLEMQFYNFQYAVDYPARIVDISKTRKKALDALYTQRNSYLGEKEKARILKKHTVPGSR